ncbi:hypothetical protein DL771_003399 [Monosporascus sp. 5C6A]|nr:hypothetical protein DL771_003399 [Monosporascus sp. 5C6A]
MTAPASDSRCGFCGYLSPHVGIGEAAWTSRFRAVYSTDPRGDAPRLSGVGLNRDADTPGNLAPQEPYQRYDDRDLDPRSLVLVRAPRPADRPSSGVPDAAAEGEQTRYTEAWGFLFHDACWRLLDQACAPDAVDVATLWRVLLSVPCARNLPNWGHNYGCLFVVGPVTKKNPQTGRQQSFMRLRAPASFIIPSTYSDPFDVPELAGTVKAMMRIGTGGEATSRANSSHRKTPVSVNGPSADTDPFAALPPEIRDMLLAYAASPDVANLRLASRAIAAVPLTQQFFRSRFWPRRELDRVFDGFLLGAAERRGRLDWAALYRETRARLRAHRVWLGERNRYRIWDQTLGPLSRALGPIARLGQLRGGRLWDVVLGDDDDDGGLLLGSRWRGVATECCIDFEAFGLQRRRVHVAEVELPRARVKAIGVSLVAFFDREYITGLRFVFSGSVDDVEIGYIAPHSETILRVEDDLRGFHAAVDPCGFRGLSVFKSGPMRAKYLTWAGALQGFESVPIKSGGDAVRRIRAAFDVRSPPSRVTQS